VKTPGDPSTWSASKQAMKRDLDAAGIEKDTVSELVNWGVDPPEVVPIMVDWLQHFEERIPETEDLPAWRHGLLRNLITPHTKGNRAAVEVLFAQFDRDPPASKMEQEVTSYALVKAAERQDLPRMIELLDSPDTDIVAKGLLTPWLGKFKTPEAIEAARRQLGHPSTAIPAMRALVRQKATGVRADVAKYLDDEHEVFRKEAQKTLDKLPADG
jgi:hypothetical protein